MNKVKKFCVYKENINYNKLKDKHNMEWKFEILGKNWKTYYQGLSTLPTFS
jgi:hypothetical protein